MTLNRWDEIEALITEHKQLIKAATTHTVLKDFAEEHGLLNKADFGKFKHILKKFGVDYTALRDATFDAENAQRAQELDGLSDIPAVRLWIAALDSEETGSFAIVDKDREARWYGRFFDDDRIWTPGDLISAEQSVADKAVWLGSKALACAGHQLGEVELVTTCPHLDSAALKAQGVRLGVKVTIVLDDGDDRAVEMAETPGYRTWKDTDLSTLVDEG